MEKSFYYLFESFCLDFDMYVYEPYKCVSAEFLPS